MNILNYIVYFVIGGVVTTLIVVFQQSNHKILSGFVTLVPVFFVLALIYIAVVNRFGFFK